MTKKKPVSIKVSPDLWGRARAAGVNGSQLFEQALSERLAPEAEALRRLKTCGLCGKESALLSNMVLSPALLPELSWSQEELASDNPVKHFWTMPITCGPCFKEMPAIGDKSLYEFWSVWERIAQQHGEKGFTVASVITDAPGVMESLRSLVAKTQAYDRRVDTVDAAGAGLIFGAKQNHVLHSGLILTVDNTGLLEELSTIGKASVKRARPKRD